jgi:AraC-like DNA-binding protein
MSDLNLDFDDLNSSDGPILFVAAGSRPEMLFPEPHSHSRGQLFGSLHGLISVDVDDGIWVVPATHAVWVPPHHFHSGRSHGTFNGWSAYITESACEDLPKRPCAIRTSGLLREAVLRASTWQKGPLDSAGSRIAEVVLDEIRSLPIEPLGLPLPRDERVQRIARALITDPADDRDLESWANWAAISSRTLSRRFVDETGFNFTAWRQRARLMRSLEMLAAGLPVTTVALDLGFSTASAYIGMFRRTFGETPSVYRQRL